MSRLHCAASPAHSPYASSPGCRERHGARPARWRGGGCFTQGQNGSWKSYQQCLPKRQSLTAGKHPRAGTVADNFNDTISACIALIPLLTAYGLSMSHLGLCLK